MGDSVGTTVSAEALETRSSGKKKLTLENSVYRTSRASGSPKVQLDPVATEILQVRQQHEFHRLRAQAVQNRIRLLQQQEEQTIKAEVRHRQAQAFRSEIRSRRVQEQEQRERLKSERQAEELDARIRHLRLKRQRVKHISTARSRVLTERRETVDEIRRVCAKIDLEVEAKKERERLFNIERRRAVERSLRQVQEQRTLSAHGHREMLKAQYRSRLEEERQRAEEEAQRLQALEKLHQEIEERVRGRSMHLPSVLND